MMPRPGRLKKTHRRIYVTVHESYWPLCETKVRNPWYARDGEQPTCSRCQKIEAERERALACYS